MTNKDKPKEVINAEKMLARIEDDFCPEIITPKIDDSHIDSFFYDGTIAQVIKPNGIELFLIATGDIRIYKQVENRQELIFDGKERNSGFDLDIADLDDEALHSLDENKYYWDMNNWFEVTWKKKDEDYIDSAMGDVAYDYNEAIELLKSYWEDNEH